MQVSGGDGKLCVQLLCMKDSQVDVCLKLVEWQDKLPPYASVTTTFFFTSNSWHTFFILCRSRLQSCSRILCQVQVWVVFPQSLWADSRAVQSAIPHFFFKFVFLLLHDAQPTTLNSAINKSWKKVRLLKQEPCHNGVWGSGIMAPRIFVCYVKKCQPLDWRLSDFNLGEWNPNFNWLGEWWAALLVWTARVTWNFLVLAGNVNPDLVTVLTELLCLYIVCKVRWIQQMVHKHNTSCEMSKDRNMFRLLELAMIRKYRQWIVNIYMYVHFIAWYRMYLSFDTCCAVLFCVVLCCVVFSCVVLSCSVLCCAVLCWDVLCCVVLCCAVLCLAVLCCVVLCCVVLCWAVLCCVGPFDAVIVVQNIIGMNRIKIVYNSLSSAVGPTVAWPTWKADKRNVAEQFACRCLLNVKCTLNTTESNVCWPTVCQLTY
jgi:hypothetical protein